jgi:hypothetical protein
MKRLDWSALNTVVECTKEKNGLSRKSDAYSYSILENMFPNCEESIEELLTEGGNDCGVDAVKIDNHGSSAHVHLFQFKFHESERKAANNFKVNQADRIVSFINLLFEEDASLKKVCNPYLWGKIQEIWSVYKQASTRFTIYLCSNGEGLHSDQKSKFVGCLDKYNIELVEIDFKRSLNLLIIPSREKTKHKFNAIEKQYLGRSDGDIKGFVGTISAKDLINMIRDPRDPDKIDPLLFDQNIRVFLGKDNPVNSSIIKTALSDRNNYFWYLNNGVTAMCSKISYRDAIRSPEVEIENVQIVNGAQTCHALFEAAKHNDGILEDILLIIRIYETSNEDLPHQIALATNSQTRIFPRDLMANSEIQVKLEKAFSGMGYFYERKKNQHEDQDSKLRIDALKLGQIIVAYHLREPEKSKKDSDKIFGGMYDDVFNLEHDIEHLRDMFLVSQRIEEMRQNAILQGKKGIAADEDSFLTYGHFHVVYLVALLSEKKSIDISSCKDRESLIEDALNIMRLYIDATKTSSFYLSFRSPKTREGLFEAAMNKGQLSFPFELKSMPA